MPDKETRTVPLGLRITPTLKAAIDKATADHERSVASYIEGVVSESTFAKRVISNRLSQGPHPRMHGRSERGVTTARHAYE